MEYGSNTILSALTLTKEPLMKNTPLLMDNEEPMCDASLSIKLTTVSPAFIGVFPYTKDSSVIRFSPSSKNEISLLSPESIYLTNRVTSVISDELEGNA